jgi:hypothetical protein
MAFVFRRTVTATCLAALLAVFLWGPRPTGAQQASGAAPANTIYSGLHWRLIGPFRGGRVNAVSGVPGQPNTFYYGSVGGGLWKSGNAGRTWAPVFDEQGVASIGAIAVAPSAPSTVYVGTGESDMRDSISIGDGMYKSSDAGKTWSHIGLATTRQISRVAVDPRNPNAVFVAALGLAYGPSADRGVYRSRDGGGTWQKVLFKNDNVGASDVVIDPADPHIVYAALWATRRPPWYIYAPSNGPGGGIFKSVDGGTTWTPLTSGLPAGVTGRIGLAVSPSASRRVYAVVDVTGERARDDGGVYRSEDAGATWTRVSGDMRVWGRGWYFGKVAVDPKNPDIVYVSNTSLYRSMDGGKSWTPIKGAPGGDDYHQLWIAPEDPSRMILASDQGAIVTVDGALTWSSWYNQSTAQLYHVATDARFPYWATGAQQDSGAVAVPSRSLHAVISMHEWTGVCAGGESGYTAPDPLHPEILFGGTVTRCNVVTGISQNVSPERGAQGGPFRHDWTQPLVFSQADPHALYFANQYVYKTVDGGDAWRQISEDLTREDPGVPPNLDEAAAADVTDAANKRRGVVYTIAPSPVRAPLVWIGTDDGLIKVTADDGKTWQDATPAAITPWSMVSMIEASHFDAGEAYAAVNRHQLTDYAAYVYRTRDGGKSWQPIARGLPVYVHSVKEDPIRRGLLFAGTELGVFVSFNDGDDWSPLQLNLPAVSARDLAVHGDDLIVATHGRGFWVLDNITPLRQVVDAAAADVFLFKPADVINMPAGNENGTPLPKDEPFGENPPTGAMVDYYLKTAPATPVAIEILDGSGQRVRRVASDDVVQVRDPNTLNVPAIWTPTPEPLSAAAGMHRWVWDLRAAGGGGGRGAAGGAAAGADAAAWGGAAGAGASAAGAAGGRGGAAGAGGRGGGAAGGGGGGGRGGATAQPGTYTVRLTVGDKMLTQPLVVKPDPRLSGSAGTPVR